MEIPFIVSTFPTRTFCNGAGFNNHPVQVNLNDLSCVPFPAHCFAQNCRLQLTKTYYITHTYLDVYFESPNVLILPLHVFWCHSCSVFKSPERPIHSLLQLQINGVIPSAIHGQVVSQETPAQFSLRIKVTHLSACTWRPHHPTALRNKEYRLWMHVIFQFIYIYIYIIYMYCDRHRDVSISHL